MVAAHRGVLIDNTNIQSNSGGLSLSQYPDMRISNCRLEALQRLEKQQASRKEPALQISDSASIPAATDTTVTIRKIFVINRSGQSTTDQMLESIPGIRLENSRILYLD